MARIGWRACKMDYYCLTFKFTRMETWIYILAAVIQLAVIIFIVVKLSDIASDIRSIRENTKPSCVDFYSMFRMLIMTGDKKAAKDLLIEEIARTNEFKEMITSMNDDLKSRSEKSIKSRFKSELELLGMSDFKFNQ